MQIKKIKTNCALQLLEKPKCYKDNISTIIVEAIEESFALFINLKKYNILII